MKFQLSNRDKKQKMDVATLCAFGLYGLRRLEQLDGMDGYHVLHFDNMMQLYNTHAKDEKDRGWIEGGNRIADKQRRSRRMEFQMETIYDLTSLCAPQRLRAIPISAQRAQHGSDFICKEQINPSVNQWLSCCFCSGSTSFVAFSEDDFLSAILYNEQTPTLILARRHWSLVAIHYQSNPKFNCVPTFLSCLEALGTPCNDFFGAKLCPSQTAEVNQFTADKRNALAKL